MSYEYPDLAKAAVDRIVATQAAAIDQAVRLIAASLAEDGVLQAFGTGHARIIVHEMAGRAGGLVPVNLVRVGDLVTYGGRSPASLLDPTLERDPSLAGGVYEHAGARDGDCFLIASNSGINGSIVEMASIVTGRGHPLIAITSMDHSTRVNSRHPSGKKLYELADVVIDTGAPAGDAGLVLEDGTAIGALSSLAGIVVVQLLTEGICQWFIEAGRRPPVYRSMNLPGSDDVNGELEVRYRGRVRPIEP